MSSSGVFPNSTRFVTALTFVRRHVGPLVTNAFFGKIVAKLFADKIPHRGFKIDTSLASVTAATKASLFFRAYESSEYRFVRDYLPKDANVIELGGSLGVISCVIRRKIDANMQLVVVEADPLLAKAVQNNLAINGCDQDTTVKNVAVAYGMGDAIHFERGPNNVSGQIAKQAGVNTITVQATTLADIVRECGFEDFCLVCDIEGVEWMILEHEPELLAKAKMIIMEAHSHPDYGSDNDFVSRISETTGLKLIDRHGSTIVLIAKESH